MTDEMKPIRIDLGCGPRKRTDGEWIGVDEISFAGVDVVMDIFSYLNSLEPETVDEINMSHVLEHFDGAERVRLMNQIYKVLKKQGKVFITGPNWSHDCAYGDPTHKWPPISSWTFYYMKKDWREVNAPHCGYECDFDFSISGAHDPNDQYLAYRNMETKMILMSRQINTTINISVTLNKI